MECNTDDFASCFSVECNMDSPYTFSLCKQHYNTLWKYRFQFKCAVCQVTIQQSAKKYLCNSLDVGPLAADTFQKIFGEQIVALDGYLCFACYILVSGQVSSLLSLEDMKKCILESLSVNLLVTTADQIIEQSLLKVYNAIIDACLDNNVVLLIDMYDLFSQNVHMSLEKYKECNFDVNYCLRTACGFWHQS